MTQQPMQGFDQQTEVITIPDKETHPPSLYKVLLHNDDYTTQEFVVSLLKTVFHKTEPEAVQIMLQVHQQGFGTAGVYPYEIAETKVARALLVARQHEFPLQCTLERE